MSYYKTGESVQTKDGLIGKILTVDFKENKPYSLTVIAEASDKYYMGERVHVLVSNVKE